MTEEPELAAIRRNFARQMVAGVGADDPPLEAAFARVPREAFLGDAPWTLVSPLVGLQRLEQNDRALVYQDVLVQLDAAAGSTTAVRRCTR